MPSHEDQRRKKYLLISVSATLCIEFLSISLTSQRQPTYADTRNSTANYRELLRIQLAVNIKPTITGSDFRQSLVR